MKRSLAAIVAFALGATAPAGIAWSQDPPPPLATASTTAPLSAAQLDQMLAPVALYPDPLVAQILMAASYPLEVVQAERWLQDPGHAGLSGDQLAAALLDMPWDASVKSLVPFPRILQMMDSRLDWLQALGDAFLAQQADVMESVQRLRRQAQAAGTLQSTPHETVATDDEAVTIEPADPSFVYVPVYNPYVVYGPWLYPDYPPFWFPPPAGFYFDGDPFLWWDVPIVVPLWGWNHWQWHRHGLVIEPERFRGDRPGHMHVPGGAWQHDPTHRLGVGYRDPATSARFSRAPAPGPAVPRVFRGFEGPTENRPAPSVTPMPSRPAPSVASPPIRSAPSVAPPPIRPAPSFTPRPAAPIFNSYGTGRDVRGDSARGHASQGTMSPGGVHGSGGTRPR